MFSKILLALSFTSAVFAASTPTELSVDAVIPISGLHMAAPLSLPGGDSRVFYQDASNGSLIGLDISNGLTEGGVFVSSSVVAPSSELRPNTPIAASAIVDPSGTDWDAMHVFFFSPDNILSEYFHVPGDSQGGPTCTTCLTSEGFVGVPGSQMLYAIQTTTELRVGFISAGAPNTISEAVNSGSGWTLASLT